MVMLMPTLYDVPADIMIKRLAEELKKNPKIKPPTWAKFVKTASYKERAPMQKDWWYYRAAAVFRKVYIKGPIGLSHLRLEFSGRKNRGYAPEHSYRASGSVIRKILQQLSDAGYVKVIEKKGRVVTDEGRSFLDKLAYEILKELKKENPAFEKYL